MPARRIVGLISGFAAIHVSAVAGAISPCDDPEVVKGKTFTSCSSTEFELETDEGRTKVTVIRVTDRNERQLDDYDHPLKSHYLLRPNRRPEFLGRFRPFSAFAARNVIVKKLGYGPALAGGLGGINFEMFYDRFLVHHGSRYCFRYRMKFPFSGELVDCDGMANEPNTVKYASEATTWRDAIAKACNQAQSEVGVGCSERLGLMRNYLQKDGKNSLHYVVTLRHSVEKTVVMAGIPLKEDWGYEYRTYLVPIAGGKATLRDVSAIIPKMSSSK